MKHRFISKLPIYHESPCCGYVDEEIIKDNVCKVCGETINEAYCWFPDSAYEYVIILEDYHSREPSGLRKEYFEAVNKDNLMEYFTSSTEPIFHPTTDWKPVTILIFRSLFELLLDHFLWKLIRVQLLPSFHAEDYASFILSRFPNVSSKRDKCYKFVTGNKWDADIERFGYKNLDNLLKETVKIRNEFIHENPLAGHNNLSLADNARQMIPDLFEYFVKLANEYQHPYAKQLGKLEIKKHCFSEG